MAGIKKLRRIQLGKETTAGLAVAATTKWRGTGTLEDKREAYFPDEDIGFVVPVNRAFFPFTQGQLDLDEVPATFEQLPHILAMGVDGVVSGTKDGIGTGYVYTYAFPTTTVKTPKTYTIEGGDNEQVEQMAYTFAESFKLSGKRKEPIMMSATLIGSDVSVLSGGFTAAATLPTVEEILFQKAKLYIDLISGTIGTTEIGCTLYEFSLDVTTGFQALYAASGSLGYCKIIASTPELKLHLVFEHNASSIAQKAAWRSLAPKLIRIKSEGSALATAGTYTNKTLIIDLAGMWEKFDKLGEDNGNDIIEADFRVAYDATAAKYAEIKVVNELASLP